MVDDHKMGDVIEKVAGTVEITGAALERLEQFWQEKRAETDRVRGAIPAVADAVLKRGMVEPGEAQELAVALQDHGKCLELLKRAALFVSAEDVGRLGQPLPASSASGQHKSASEGLPPGGYIGRRRSEPDEGWLKFERDLGL